MLYVRCSTEPLNFETKERFLKRAFLCYMCGLDNVVDMFKAGVLFVGMIFLHKWGHLQYLRISRLFDADRCRLIDIYSRTHPPLCCDHACPPEIPGRLAGF